MCEFSKASKQKGAKHWSKYLFSSHHVMLFHDVITLVREAAGFWVRDMSRRRMLCVCKTHDSKDESIRNRCKKTRNVSANQYTLHVILQSNDRFYSVLDWVETDGFQSCMIKMQSFLFLNIQYQPWLLLTLRCNVPWCTLHAANAELFQVASWGHLAG